MDEEQYLLNADARKRATTLESDEEWSDNSSESSSYYSDYTDSSEPEWESYVEQNGTLLYIDCHPMVTAQHSNVEEPKLAKNQTRKSTRGKFLRLIRRRDSKRRSKRLTKQNENQESKVTFQDYDNGEIREVILPITSTARSKHGRRMKLSESVLGISTSTFSDGARIMVAGFTQSSDAGNEKNIKIGDWLRAINDVNVTVENFQRLLMNLEEDEVKLELQRVTGVEVTKQPPQSEITNQSDFVKQLTECNVSDEVSEALLAQPIGILYLDASKLSETGPEFEEIIYAYPMPMERNCLCQSRGIFITLTSLVEEITQTKPHISSVLCNKRLTHIVYNIFDSNKLLLFMLPDNRITSQEILQLNNEVLHTLRFMYANESDCFIANRVDDLNHYFSRFFARVLSSGLWSKAEQTLELSDFPEKALLVAPYQFEELQPASHYISLPNEAQMQIDDALSELEACDYREWNEEPLDCQRLFTILGSAFYHSGYLLASHFVHEDLVDVHLYCRQQGLFHLAKTEPIRSMVLWREVFPRSCKECGDDSRRYLLIVGSGKDLLMVIMEAGGCTEAAEENLAPDAFYVEEAQATLAHLQELGIGELAARWISSNPGSQVTIPQLPPLSKRRSDFLGNINFTKSSTLSPNNKEASPPTTTNKKPEVTSILKRRYSDQGAPLLHNLTQSSNSIFSIQDESELQSEDSVSQGGYSERSEVSDEQPVIGRRVLRERCKNFEGSGDDESDIDDYRDGSQMSTNSYDLSELRQSLLNELGDVQPPKLTAGHETVLYHYVQLDFTEGILLAPPECRIESPTMTVILNNFRKCCQEIHKIFETTLRFKNMSSQEMSKSVMNKSLVAIKEYGKLFETVFQDESNRKGVAVTYWVIGRLFYMPHPREMYICYQDTIPQNLIEIAYKLGRLQLNLIVR